MNLSFSKILGTAFSKSSLFWAFIGFFALVCPFFFYQKFQLNALRYIGGTLFICWLVAFFGYLTLWSKHLLSSPDTAFHLTNKKDVFIEGRRVIFPFIGLMILFVMLLVSIYGSFSFWQFDISQEDIFKHLPIILFSFLYFVALPFICILSATGKAGGLFRICGFIKKNFLFLTTAKPLFTGTFLILFYLFLFYLLEAIISTFTQLLGISFLIFSSFFPFFIIISGLFATCSFSVAVLTAIRQESKEKQ